MKKYIALFLTAVLVTGSTSAFAFSSDDWENPEDYNRIAAKPEIIHPLYNQTEKSIMKRIYVDANFGSDENNGTEDAPFKTIEHAKDVVRTLNSNMHGNIEVILKEGIYRPKLTTRKEALYDPVPVEHANTAENQNVTAERKLRETRDVMQTMLQFTHEDSGTNGYSVVYKAADGANPVISGGVPVNGWELYDAQKNIYRARANGIHTRNLIVNGQPVQRAVSSPKYNIDDYYGLFSNCVVDDEGLIVDDDYFLEWDNLKDTELVFLDPTWWAPRVKIDSAYKTEDGHTRIVLEQPSWFFNRYKAAMSIKKGPHYIENNLALLDEDNEWYLDRTNDYFYYKPENGIDANTLDIEASLVEELILFMGNSSDECVSDIEFRDITVRNTTWLRPDTANGYADSQSNWLREDYSVNVFDIAPISAVTLKYAKRILIEHCDFENLGSNGIYYDIGSQDCLFIGNVVNNISGSGVVVGGIDYITKSLKDTTDKADMVVNNDVYSNRISKCAIQYYSGVGVSVGTSRDVDVSYNEISECNYTGLHLSWGNYNEELIDKEAEHVTIQNNLIYDTNILLNDGAPIYTRGPWYGSGDDPSIISGNYIACDGYNASVHGIYYDSGTYGWMSYNNYVQGYGGGITINIFSDCNISSFNSYLDVLRQVTVFQGREDLPYMLTMGLDLVNGYEGLPDGGKQIMENSGVLDEYSDVSLLGEDDIFTIVPAQRRLIAGTGAEFQLKFYALNKHGKVLDNSSMKYGYEFFSDLTSIRYNYYKGVITDSIETKAGPVADKNYAVLIDSENMLSCIGTSNGFIWVEGEQNGKKYHTVVGIYSNATQNVVNDALKYTIDGTVNVMPFYSSGMSMWEHLNDFEEGSSIEYEINPPTEFGEYDVMMFAPPNAKSGIFSIYLNGELVYDSIDFYARQGIQYLKIPKISVNEKTQGQMVKVKILCNGKNPAAELRRLGVYGFEFTRSLDIGDSILLAPDSGYMSKNGIKNAMNSANSNAKTVVINGSTFVPIEFVFALDNAQASYENGVAVVKSADSQISFDEINGEVFNDNGQIYIPLRKVSEALGYKVNWYDEGLIVLGDAGEGKTLKELYQMIGMVKGKY